MNRLVAASNETTLKSVRLVVLYLADNLASLYSTRATTEVAPASLGGMCHVSLARNARARAE